MTGTEIKAIAECIVAENSERFGAIGKLRTVIFEGDDGQYCVITATVYEIDLIDAAVFGEAGFVEEVVE